MLTAPRGTSDVLPTEASRWQHLEAALRRTAERFGYREIRVPTFEHTELIRRGAGDATDVVQKETYTFEDRGGRSITLRPEGTASVVRAFIEHGLFGQTLPFKVYYILPNFRYEKPQAGRLREHHQFGVECFGAAGALADAEVILLGHTFLRGIGLGGMAPRLNSIGCSACRPAYQAVLLGFLKERREKLCATCLDRMERNPMRVLDCKSPVCQEAVLGAPPPLDYLCADCQAHWDALTSILDRNGIGYLRDDRLVRGFDYYTRTVFEFHAEGIGAQAAICAGGRYDGLVGEIGGPPTPGLGFGSGLERLLLALAACGVDIRSTETEKIVFVASAGSGTEAEAFRLTQALRGLGQAAECDLMGRSLKAQMKYADKIGAAYSLTVGPDELSSGRVQLRNMRSGALDDLNLTASDIARSCAKCAQGG